VDYEEILQCLADCRFTDHARREMESEPFGVIRVDEVLHALETGEIIEEYCLHDGTQNSGGGGSHEVRDLQNWRGSTG